MRVDGLRGDVPHDPLYGGRRVGVGRLAFVRQHLAGARLRGAVQLEAGGRDWNGRGKKGFNNNEIIEVTLTKAVKNTLLVEIEVLGVYFRTTFI